MTIPALIAELEATTLAELNADDPLTDGDWNQAVRCIKHLTDLCKQLKEWDCPAVGGKYVRYPRREVTVNAVTSILAEDPEPEDRWPGTVWQNVGTFFSGAFFRIEGGKAESFGSEMQTHALQDHAHWGGAKYPGTNGPEQNQNGAVEDRTEFGINTSGPVAKENGPAPNVADETRPDNFTIQLWQRSA